MAAETSIDQPSNFSWYELHTPDSAAAQAFYSGVLGWGMQDPGMPEGLYTLVTVGGTPIGGLLQKPASSFTAGASTGWMGYIGVGDIERYSARLVEAGGIVHRPSQAIPGVGYFAVVADPQGAIFVLFQPLPGQAPPEMPAPGTPGSAAWHDLAAADWETDFAFYADLFGWTKDRAMNMGPNGVYQIFAIGGVPMGGMMTRMDPTQKPGWLFYFNVEEIHAAIGRVNQHGGKIIHGPSEVPGGMQIAHCVDPQGATFGIVAPNS